MGNLNGEPISKGSAEEEPKLAKNWSASDYVSPTEIVWRYNMSEIAIPDLEVLFSLLRVEFSW